MHLIMSCIVLLFGASSSFAEHEDEQGIREITGEPAPVYSKEKLDLIKEHVYGGLPEGAKVLVNQGYVVRYDEKRRIPLWAAYHIIPDYRNTPERKKRFASFRKDKRVKNGTVTREYTNFGYDRGHFAPFGIMGGDRDHDGTWAHLEGESDSDDERTVREANLLTNIAPQHAYFNSRAGLWYNLERLIQDKIVSPNREVWAFAGAIPGKTEFKKIGPKNDISVPPLFYKIVVIKNRNSEEEPKVLAFLFPHQMEKRGAVHGQLAPFIVSVDLIESLTGLDFFRETTPAIEEWKSTWNDWNAIQKIIADEKKLKELIKNLPIPLIFPALIHP